MLNTLVLNSRLLEFAVSVWLRFVQRRLLYIRIFSVVFFSRVVPVTMAYAIAEQLSRGESKIIQRCRRGAMLYKVLIK